MDRCVRSRCVNFQKKISCDRIIRDIFQAYLELGSVHALQRRLEVEGIYSQQRTTRDGKVLGGQPFSCGALFYLLRNRIYLGLIAHKDKTHPACMPPSSTRPCSTPCSRSSTPTGAVMRPEKKTNRPALR
jgi:hypothetical protein